MGFMATIFLWGLSVLIAVTFAAVIVIIIYARWHYGSLEKLGIPVIKPHWFLGSNPDGHKRIQPHVDMERAEKYGPIYGVYDGRTPTIFVSDPKLLRLIQSTDFEHFRNHRRFLTEHEIPAEVLDFLEDEKWKEVRQLLTPHFTSGKIKHMCETISDISEEYVTSLVKELGDQKETKIDFRMYSPPLILEIIGKIFCGINLENASSPDNAFVKNMKIALGSEGFNFDWTYTLATTLPFLVGLFPVFATDSMNEFGKTILEILDGRDKSKVIKQDMVNTLLEMTKKAKSDPKYKKLGITQHTALGQAFEFFVASYEAVRSVLTFLMYYLVMNPEIQEKLLEEIDKVLTENGDKKISWETVADMPYLTACLTEVMRLEPGFFRPDRKCTKDWEHEGIKIKKDMIVIFPLFAIHHDAKSYTDPHTFDPERFMPGRKEKLDPYAFGMFGMGPRACIGQRFAYEMLKIIMTNYMKIFRFEKRADTQLDYSYGNPLFLQTKPIYVNFVKRN